MALHLEAIGLLEALDDFQEEEGEGRLGRNPEGDTSSSATASMAIQITKALKRVQGSGRCRNKMAISEGPIGMHHAPDTVCGEAGVEGKGALLGQGLDCAVHGPGVGHGAVRKGLHLLHARLDEVKGEAEGCANDTGAESSTDHCGLVRRLVTEVLHKHLLDLQVHGEGGPGCLGC